MLCTHSVDGGPPAPAFMRKMLEGGVLVHLHEAVQNIDCPGSAPYRAHKTQRLTSDTGPDRTSGSSTDSGVTNGRRTDVELCFECAAKRRGTPEPPAGGVLRNRLPGRRGGLVS